MKAKLSCIILFAVTVLIACKQDHYFSEYKSVDIKSWKSTDTLFYVLDIEDSKALYDIAVSVRHQKNYEFSNLWLNIIDNYSNLKTAFRLEVPLFKKDGNPFGKVSGSLCTQNMPFQKNIKFPKPGKYKIRIVQLMRKDPLDGISDIGIIVDKK
jgi:gliding motility-associated lipoprotein GldH